MFGKNENIVNVINNNGDTLLVTNKRMFRIVDISADKVKVCAIKCEIVDSDPDPETDPDGECDHVFLEHNEKYKPIVVKCRKCGYVLPHSDSESDSDITPTCDHDYQIDSVNPDLNICVKCNHVQSEA